MKGFSKKKKKRKKKRKSYLELTSKNLNHYFHLITVLHIRFRITHVETRVFSLLPEVHYGRNFVSNFCRDELFSGK